MAQQLVACDQLLDDGSGSLDHGQHSGVELAFIAAARAVSRCRLEGAVVRRASVSAEQDKLREVAGEAHHPECRLHRSLRPVHAIRSRWSEAACEIVSVAQDLRNVCAALPMRARCAERASAPGIQGTRHRGAVERMREHDPGKPGDVADARERERSERALQCGGVRKRVREKRRRRPTSRWRQERPWP